MNFYASVEHDKWGSAVLNFFIIEKQEEGNQYMKRDICHDKKTFIKYIPTLKYFKAFYVRCIQDWILNFFLT